MYGNDESAPVGVVLLRAFNFFRQVDGQHGQRDQLRVGVLQRGAGGFPVILENQDELEAAVLLEVKDSVAEGPKHIFDALGRQRSQGRVVIRGFNDDLVRADAVHAVKHALGLAVQATLDPKGGELVRHHANRPARRIALRR